jgi:hypothetical protein
MPLFPRRPKPATVKIESSVFGPGASPAAGEARTLEIGKQLLGRARAHKTGLLSARFYSDKLMEWSMRDQNFKVQLFRFVDAFPMLKTPEAIHEHLTDYLTQPGVKLPPGLDFGLKVGGMAKGLAAATISKQIRPRPSPTSASSGTTASPSPLTSSARRASRMPRPTSISASTWT